MESTDQLKNKSLPDVVKLLYRDDIRQKHSNKSRLRGEIGKRKLEESQHAQQRKEAGKANAGKLDFYSEMLVKHLLQAEGWGNEGK